MISKATSTSILSLLTGTAATIAKETQLERTKNVVMRMYFIAIIDFPRQKMTLHEKDVVSLRISSGDSVEGITIIGRSPETRIVSLPRLCVQTV
jgi:hypothetical protein